MSETRIASKTGLSGQGRDSRVLNVEGMTCGHCVNALQEELAAVPGVVSAKVDLGAGTATVVGSPTTPELEAAVKRGGYKVGSATASRQGGCGCGC